MKAFRYDFSMKELSYLLFSKKNCPKCRNKMKKEKCYEMVDGSIFNTASVPLYIQGRKKVKYYHYLFNCPNCSTQYTLKELIKKKGKDGI